MKSESLFESNKEIVLDEKSGRAVIVNKQEDEQNKAKQLEDSKVQLEDVRRNYTRDHVIQRGDVNLTEDKLKNHFEKQQMPDDLKVLNNVKIDYGAINRSFDSMKAEVSLFAESFAQGVLSLFNVEVDKAVERYEERLHVMEDKDYDSKKVDFNINKLSNGERKTVSPNYNDDNKATEKLNEFNKQQDIKKQKQEQKQEQTKELRLERERTKEEENQ